MIQAIVPSLNLFYLFLTDLLKIIVNHLDKILLAFYSHKKSDLIKNFVSVFLDISLCSIEDIFSINNLNNAGKFDSWISQNSSVDLSKRSKAKYLLFMSICCLQKFTCFWLKNNRFSFERNLILHF